MDRPAPEGGEDQETLGIRRDQVSAPEEAGSDPGIEQRLGKPGGKGRLGGDLDQRQRAVAEAAGDEARGLADSFGDPPPC